MSDATMFVCEAAASVSVEAIEQRFSSPSPVSTAGVNSLSGHEQGVDSSAKHTFFLAQKRKHHANSVQETTRVAKSPPCRRGVEWVVPRPNNFAAVPVPAWGCLALAMLNVTFNANTMHTTNAGE